MADVPGPVRPVWPSLKIRTALAPAERALATFSTKVQLPRWISAMLPLTSGGKSLIAQPARLPSGVPTGGIVIRLTGITRPVTSAVCDHVIVATSAFRPGA